MSPVVVRDQTCEPEAKLRTVEAWVNGTITGTYSNDTARRMIGHVVATCGCGWTGTSRYPTTKPFDDEAVALMLHDWEHAHARPTLQGDQLTMWGRLRTVLQFLAAEHHATLTTDSIRTLGEADRLDVLDCYLAGP